MNTVHSARSGTGQGQHFADFEKVSGHLDALGLFRMMPGLERMTAMLSRLDLRRPPFTVVQVVGTNGKGSTSTMLERLAREHGLCTGLHTSPHFVSVRERVRVNGLMLSESVWTGLANTLMRNKGEELSYFEFVTCLAVLAFAEANVDIAVMETGLGGTFDATTALDADLVVLTPFALDHQAVLGPTLQDIARDKSGSIRAGKPVLSAPQQPEAEREIRRATAERGSPLQTVPKFEALPEALQAASFSMRLTGEYQIENRRLALAAWKSLNGGKLLSLKALETVARRTRDIPEKCIEASALASAWLPGRMQTIAPRPSDNSFPCASGWPPLLLDGAHNSHGLAALGLSLARQGTAPGAVIFSCLADKDLHQLLPHLRSLATGPIFVPPIADNPRAMPPEELARLIGLNAQPAASFSEALAGASRHLEQRLPEVFSTAVTRHPLLICGSLYMLGEFFRLRPDCLEML